MVLRDMARHIAWSRSLENCPACAPDRSAVQWWQQDLRSRHHHRIGNLPEYAGVVWFLEEDFVCRLIERWHGDGIIADFDDLAMGSALAGVHVPVVAVWVL